MPRNTKTTAGMLKKIIGGFQMFCFGCVALLLFEHGRFPFIASLCCTDLEHGWYTFIRANSVKSLCGHRCLLRVWGDYIGWGFCVWCFPKWLPPLCGLRRGHLWWMLPVGIEGAPHFMHITILLGRQSTGCFLFDLENGLMGTIRHEMFGWWNKGF